MKFVYIQNNLGLRNWMILLNEINYDELDKLEDIRVSVLTRKSLSSNDRGLGLDSVMKYTSNYKSNLVKHIEEGKTLLINQSGAFRFLTSEDIILDSVEGNYFPKESNELICGMISPKGDFLRCNYGEHYKLANKLSEEADKDDYVIISYDEIGHNSSIYIPQKLSECQKNFIKENKSKIDSKSILKLKEYNIL